MSLEVSGNMGHLNAEEWQPHAGPSLRLEHLLTQLAGRGGEVAGVQARMRGLLAAVVGVARELRLPATLRKIVEAACSLVDAEYGALAVIGPDGRVGELIHVGADVGSVADAGACAAADASAYAGACTATATANAAAATAADAAADWGGWPLQGEEPPGALLREPRAWPAPGVAARPEAPETPDTPEAFEFTIDRPVTVSLLEVPIMVGGEVFGTLYLGGKRGGACFTREDEELVAALAAAVGFAIENARHYEQTRQRQAWLAASVEITTALLSASEPDAALHLVARRARQVTSAAIAAILVPAAPGTLAVAVADVVDVAGTAGTIGATDAACDGLANGSRQAPLAGRVLAAGGGRPGSPAPLAETMDSGRAMLVTEEPAELFGDPDVGVELGTAMVVPLVAAGRSLGLLVIGIRPETARHTGLDLEMATAFAGHAALALELSRVQRDRERLAVFEDRDRIARDLHDVVIQRLFATGLSLQGLSRTVDGSPGERVAAAAGELDQTIADIRRTVFSLAAPAGEGIELRAKILEIVQHAEHHLGLRPTVRIEGAVERGVPEPIHLHLLAVLREALANIARHARASRVHVLVRVTTDEVLAEVGDNGCGPGGASRRSGLANLRRRAVDLGGHMEFGPGTDGTGTTVTWRVPLAQPVPTSRFTPRIA